MKAELTFILHNMFSNAEKQDAHFDRPSYMIFGNKTGFLGNNLANVDHISMNMRDKRSMKVFKIFSKFQTIRWKNFQVHKNSSGMHIIRYIEHVDFAENENFHEIIPINENTQS